MDERQNSEPRPAQPRQRSGLAVFLVFLAVFAFCAALVVWLVTRPFRDVATRSAERAATSAPAPATGPAPVDRDAVLLAVGSPGSGEGEFDDLRAIAVDGQGRVFASDFNRTGRVQVFDAKGTFVAQWRVDDRYPVSGMAATTDGVVYVVQHGRISKYDSDGKRLSTLSYERGFHDVTVLPDGRAVAYGWFEGHDRIVFFDEAGRVAREVTDQLQERLKETLLDGQIAADRTGRAWVLAGLETPTILEFSPAGTLVRTLPSGKARAQQFSGSAEIATDGAGRLLVTGRDGVQLWSTEGEHLVTLPTDGQPRDLAVVDPSAVWVSTAHQRLVKLALPPPKR
jgi:streptogramin lyase